MKKVILITFSICITFLMAISCIIQKNELFNENVVIISGQIENWDELGDNQTIGLINNDIASGKQVSLVERINQDGTFKFSFEKYNPQDIWLEYNNELKTLFVHPGDSIFLRFDIKNFEYSDNFTGDAANANQDIQEFMKRFTSYQKEETNNKKSQLKPVDYKQLVYDQQLKYDSLFNAFIKEQKPCDDIALWAKVYLDYTCADDLISMVYRPNIKLPTNYWDFFNDYPIDNKEAVICSNYWDYVKNYPFYLMFFQNKLEDAVNYYKQEKYYQFLKSYTDTLVNNTQGIALDIILTQVYFEILGLDFAAVDSLLPIYNNLVQNRILKKQLFDAIRLIELTGKDQIALPNTNLTDLQNDDIVGELFAHLINKYKGEVLYIDFWAPWCGPCMREMPQSSILHSDYKEKGVTFIYLCSQSTPEKWKVTIEEKKIEGEHYYLSDDQFNVLKSKFQMQGIPWYLLVNKQGKVIDENAPRPSSEKVRYAIENLLSESNSL